MTQPPRPQHHRRTSDVVKRARHIDYAAEALPASVAAAQMDLPQNPANGVEVRNVTKRFRISTQSMGRMSSFLFHRLISGARREDFYAVKDVSFDIKRGEMLGILGVNGSGKSTLLKMITGITTPTSGDIRRLPRIAPLLDLGAGFHPALSGYENIFLNGSIIGLHREEIRELLPKIIQFSGLDHKFLEAPVRTYSAGMMARLGFAVAVSVDPDIILIDEVLAVGDLEFQAKSAQRLLEFREQGKAMALVSHTSAAIGELSTEAIWLHQGQMRLAGDAVDVVSAYNAHLTDQVRRAGRKIQDERMQEQSIERPHTVFFDRCELRNEHGLPANEFESRGHLTISFEVDPRTADQPQNQADILVTLQYQTGVIVEEFFASDRGFQPLAPGAGRCHVEITFDPLLLLPGDYVLELSAVDVTDSEAILGISPEMAFEVTGPLTSFGVYPALVPVEFRTE